MTNALKQSEQSVDSLFQPGVNCCETDRASHATLLVDCANYYRALHAAIANAKHSVFVLGWDIDSRIKLLRGEYAEGAKHPIRFFDLIKWKAQENPDVEIYLNRWDYPLFMAKEREGFVKHRWEGLKLPNLRYCEDNTVPLGASHHQKVVVVDDEIAFVGGMDVALNRWDMRTHMPSNHNRIDPGVMYSPWKPRKFQPYHDTQMIVAGPLVKSLAQLARRRWKQIRQEDPIPIRQIEREIDDLPPAWPGHLDVDFTDVNMAISLTMAPWKERGAIHQVEQMYLDLIGRAEYFIYIENQFLCHLETARALNKRLREKPDLRVLIVSNKGPNGVWEANAMWHGRVQFRDILMAGGMEDRVVMAHPISKVGEEEKPVRIHSKLMAVDDRYLRVGSSNINNRSMYTDSECDLVIEADEDDTETREKIAFLRNDLIREHTGREYETIAHLIEHGEKMEKFLNYISHSRQHLVRIDDEKYRRAPLAWLGHKFIEPAQPLTSPRMTAFIRQVHWHRLGLVVLAIIALALIWKYTPLAQYATPDYVIPILEQVRETTWAVPAAMAIYTIGTLAFFPHMLMTGTIVVVFAPLQAFSIAMVGSLLSGAIGFYAGKFMGLDSARKLVGNSVDKVSFYAKRGGVVGITLLRLLPIAPYTVVNMALGMLEVTFFAFSVGTFLGTLPGTATAAFLGHSMLELWKNPNAENLTYIGIGLLFWVGIIVGSHLGARWWRKRKAAREGATETATA